MGSKYFSFPDFVAEFHVFLPPSSGLGATASVIGSLTDEFSVVRQELRPMRQILCQRRQGDGRYSYGEG